MEAMGNRKGILKSILKQLHQGARVEDVKDQAQKVMKELTAEEIAEVEQELIEDGIPRETIQKLCDIQMCPECITLQPFLHEIKRERPCQYICDQSQDNDFFCHQSDNVLK